MLRLPVVSTGACLFTGDAAVRGARGAVRVERGARRRGLQRGLHRGLVSGLVPGDGNGRVRCDVRQGVMCVGVSSRAECGAGLWSRMARLIRCTVSGDGLACQGLSEVLCRRPAFGCRGGRIAMWRCVIQFAQLRRVKSDSSLAGTALSMYLLSMLLNARCSFHLHICACIIAVLLSNV